MSGLPRAATIIVLVSVLAGTGVIVLDDIAQGQETTVAVVNDTTTINGAAAVALDAASVANFVRLTAAQNASVTVSNGSAGSAQFIVAAGNYTINPDTATICCAEGVMNTAGDYNISYSYQLGAEDRNVLTNGIGGVQEATSWLDIIALVLAGAVILGLVGRVMRVF